MVDLERFWEVKMEAKIDFWEVFLRCFFRVRFGIDFLVIFSFFLISEPWFLCAQPVFCNDLHKIDVFEKDAKKHGFWSGFRRPKPRKIEKKRCWKACFFWTSIFTRFFADFSDFGSILGGPGPSKNWLKIEKIEFFRFFGTLSFEGEFWKGFWDSFGRILGGFSMDFGRLFEDLGMIFPLRASLKKCIRTSASVTWKVHMYLLSDAVARKAYRLKPHV